MTCCNRSSGKMWRWSAMVVWMIGTAIVFAPPRALGQFKYTPDAPEVEQMVLKAIAFIERSQDKDIGRISMHAIAICEATKRYENRIPTEVPLVATAITSAANFTLDANGETPDFNTMYEPCVASIFLGIVDPVRFEPNIQATLRLIAKRQQPSGTWRYKSDRVQAPAGDTSQTQYCCLSIWAASQHGIYVDPEVPKRALDWLTQTQSPNGGWVYRATPGQQGGGETLSISAAGAGGMFMLLDALGAQDSTGRKRAKRAGADLPSFITEYTPDADGGGDAQNDEAASAGGGIDKAATSKSLAAAGNFFGENFTPNPSEWPYYYLYGFERYAFFREQVDSEVSEVPDWYDQGVEFLKANQLDDGSWKSVAVGEQGVLPSVTTSFAVLFLVRSTQLLAGDSAKSTLRGQGALPKGNVEYRNGKIIGQAIEADISDFLTHVDTGVDIKAFAESVQNMVLPADPAKRELYMAKLRLLVTDEDAYKRLVAVRALSESRDLNNVPALIMAMKDDEDQIKTAAHIGLRFISRKMNSIKLSETPSEGDFLAARKQWIDWYKSIRPNDRQVIE